MKRSLSTQRLPSDCHVQRHHLIKDARQALPTIRCSQSTGTAGRAVFEINIIRRGSVILTLW
jgi:hypothetical protein